PAPGRARHAAGRRRRPAALVHPSLPTPRWLHAEQGGMNTSALIRTALFIAMEAAWLAALALFVDAMIVGTGSLTMASVLVFYPAGIAAELASRRFRAGRWGIWAIRIIAFCVVAALVMQLAFPPGGRLWDASGFGCFADAATGGRLIALACLGLF